MKSLKTFIIVLLFSFNKLIAQDTIHWRSDYKLKWEDFQGDPDPKSSVKAISYAEVSGNMTYNNDTFIVKFTCVFLKNKSWTLSDSRNLLLHEQGHFDIAELFARKLRRAFKEYKFNPKTATDDYNNIFSKLMLQKNKMTEAYDNDTNRSINKERQVYWNKKIAKELKKYSFFEK